MQVLLPLLLAAAAAAAPQAGPPPPVRLVPPPEIGSDRFRRQLAREQSAALRRAARSRRSVTRTFAVGWERHHGVFLVAAEAENWLAADRVIPDFAAKALADRFAVAFAPGRPGPVAHVGQKLHCRCTGVAWSFYGEQRFLVREAELSWK